MKGKYFSGAVLKKDVTRFAPVWGLYTIFMFLFLFDMWEVDRARFAMNVPIVMKKMGMVNLVYAGLTAIMLFGDLFRNRTGNDPAIALCREGWFLTHLMAGMLFCIVPNLLVALPAGVMMDRFSFLAYVWLGQVILMYLSFFGVAVFSCLLAHNRLGAAAVYAIIHFFAVVVTFLARKLYIPLLWGVSRDLYSDYSLSHMATFARSNFVVLKYDNLTQEVSFMGFEAPAWQCLFVTAAVGVVLLGLSLLIYRKQNLEAASSFLPRKAVAPVFLTLFSLLVGVAMYFVADSNDSGPLVFWCAGLVIGYFAGQMLLHQQVNVFNKKVIFRFCIFAVALGLSLVVTWLDPIGITRYVPKTENVAQVKVSPYAAGSGRDNENIIVLTDAEDVEEITQMHRQIIQVRPAFNDMSISNDMLVNMQYTLKSGQEVERLYQVGINSDWGKTLKSYYSAPECVFGTDDLEKMLENTVKVVCWPHTGKYGVPSIMVALKDSPKEGDLREFENQGSYQRFGLLTENRFNQEPAITELIDAIKRDCARGRMSQHEFHHYGEDLVARLTFYYYDETGEINHKMLNVYIGCTYTIEYLCYLPVKRDLSK